MSFLRLGCSKDYGLHFGCLLSLVLHSFILREASYHIVSCPTERVTWQRSKDVWPRDTEELDPVSEVRKVPFQQATKQLHPGRNATQPEARLLSSETNRALLESWDEITTDSLIETSGGTSRQRHPAKLCPDFRHKRSCDIINVWFFMPLRLGATCDTAIEN